MYGGFFMGKKSIALLIVAIMCCTLIFTACNKDKYTDPSTGGEFVLVTDENGNKVLSEDGELVVYATDEDGQKIKDDDGNFVTEIHGFVGQIESDGVIEDYAYYFTLPKGWKPINDRGEFENKSDKATLHIEILEMTFSDAKRKINRVYDVLNEQSVEGSIKNLIKNEYDNLKVGSKIYTLGVETEEDVSLTIVFQNNKNSYQFTYKTTSDISVEDAEKKVISIINDFIKFKPYTYYPDLNNKPAGE
jgi:hypothetical protein